MKMCFWNNEHICSKEDSYDVGLPGHVWMDCPANHDMTKKYKLENGEIVEVPISEYDPTRLRVFRSLPMDQDPLISDFTILGFRKMSPSYDRGKKLRAEYKCATKEELIVEKIFQDVRDENGILTGLQVTFNWYAEDNVVRASKTEIVKSFNKYEAETEERKRRYRQFDYLRASVKGTPNEPYIAMLVGYYSVEITKYQDDGLLDLDVAMANTLNTDLSTLTPEEQQEVGTIQQILLAPIERNDGLGMTTVQKAMQYQMGTITIEEL